MKLSRDKGFYFAKVQKIRGQILVSLIGRFVKLQNSIKMSKFFLIVSIIYVTYYAANIIYDGFLKKTHVEENNEGDEFVIEGDEQPKKITVEDISYDGSFSENGSVGGREIELSVEETNIINGTIEDQGISVNSFLSEIGKQLSGESKQMFAGVNF